MKWVVWGLCFLLAAIAGAVPTHNNDLLILIQPAVAGPVVDAQNYWKPEWVLWPPTRDKGNGGRLMAMSTGANWVGNPTYFQSKGFAELQRVGYFDARQKLLGSVRTDLLVGASGAANPSALLLALNEDSPNVKPYKVGSAWPSNSLMIAEASSWDEERAFSNATNGRVLVVEYPPPAETPWTRYWLEGSGWPTHQADPKLKPHGQSWTPQQEDSRVPGLIRARTLMQLVTRPSDFDWVPVDQRSWPGANVFLQTNRACGPWVAGCWIALAAIAIVWGAVVVNHERTNRILPIVLGIVLLSPAIVDLAGLAGRYLGVEAWSIWLLLAAYLLMAASAILGALQRRYSPRLHPLASTFAVGFVAILMVDPVWSFMSPVFADRPWYISPVAIASAFGYLTGIVACLHGCGNRWKWVGRLCCGAFFVVGLTAQTWWYQDLNALLVIPIFAWLIGESRFQWPMLLVLLAWPASLAPVVLNGLVWSPSGLLLNGQDSLGLNVYDHVEFLLSPGLFVFLIVGGGIAVFGHRFFFHQISNLKRLDMRRGAVATSAVAAACYGVLHPIFLYGGLILAAGGMATLLFDAVQTM